MQTASDFMQTYAARQPGAADWCRRARAVLAGGVGHDLRHFEPTPLYISRARGARKWDVDGNEYIDFLMGNAALLLGHADPEVVEAVTRTVRDGTHFGNDHPLQIEWAEKVCELIPCAERIRFVNSGTEATALAIRIARAYTRRPKLLRLAGHFHGWHDEVVHGFQMPFEADGSLGVPVQVRANQVMIPDGDFGCAAEVLEKDRGIAAVIVEASGGSWGRVPLDVEYVRGLRELTKKHGALLIFDEVITGFRWSPGGAQKQMHVTPDLACLAKILGGGMPCGAVVGREEVMRLCDPKAPRLGRVVHQGTFNAAPPSAAAGLATLRRLADGTVIQRVNQLAELLRNSWDQVLEKHGIAGYVYGPASTFHVYFETDPAKRAAARSRNDLHTGDARLLKGMPAPLVEQYQRHLRYRGLDIMSSTGGVLSASHTEEDIAKATDAFEASVLALRDEGLVYSL